MSAYIFPPPSSYHPSRPRRNNSDDGLQSAIVNNGRIMHVNCGQLQQDDDDLDEFEDYDYDIVDEQSNGNYFMENLPESLVDDTSGSSDGEEDETGNQLPSNCVENGKTKSSLELQSFEQEKSCLLLPRPCLSIGSKKKKQEARAASNLTFRSLLSKVLSESVDDTFREDFLMTFRCFPVKALPFTTIAPGNGQDTMDTGHAHVRHYVFDYLKQQLELDSETYTRPRQHLIVRTLFLWLKNHYEDFQWSGQGDGQEACLLDKLLAILLPPNYDPSQREQVRLLAKTRKKNILTSRRGAARGVDIGTSVDTCSSSSSSDDCSSVSDYDCDENAEDGQEQQQQQRQQCLDGPAQDLLLLALSAKSTQRHVQVTITLPVYM